MTRVHAGPAEANGHRIGRMGSVPDGLVGRYRRDTDPDPSSTGSDPDSAGSDPDDTGSDPDSTGRPQRCPAQTRRCTSRLGAAIRRFGRGEHGGAAIESAIAIAVLVAGFAGLMEVVQASYTDDRMARAARAAAHTLALDPKLAQDPNPVAAACAPIRRELALADDFDCATASWTLKVDRGVGTDVLPATLDASVTAGSGDMVLVRIGQASKLRWIGLARCEAALCGPATS